MIVSVARAAALLAQGEVVAYPTETLYALGADACTASAVAALRARKGRAAESGLSVLVADVEALDAFAAPLPERARALADRYWPGPLTLVVPVRDPALACVATGAGVGFRCSPQPTAAALARAHGRPIVATSANKSGEPPCERAEEVETVFGPELPIAGGEPAGGLAPSTVVAVAADGALSLLREGAVGFAEIEAAA